MSNKTIAAGLVICGLAAIPAHAENVDYGSLESLFGEPVTTAATGTPQRASEVAADMTIVTADEIRRSGARNIPQALRMVPGLTVLQSGLNSFDIGIRGYQQAFQPRLLVLVDGRQVFVDDYSRTIWDNIPVNLDDVRQIEVVRGAATALFGSNAASGVINIVTYSPMYDTKRVASASVGTQQSSQADSTMTVNGRWGGTKFSAGFQEAREFETGRYALDQNPTFSPMKRYASNSSVFQVAPNLQVNSEFTVAHSRSNPADATDYNIIGAQDTKSGSARLGFSYDSSIGTISNDNYWNYNAYYLDEPFDGGVPFGYATNLFVSKLQDQFSSGDHTGRVALEYRHLEGRLHARQDVLLSQTVATDTFAVNGTWLWKLSNEVSWTNALRLASTTSSLNGDWVDSPAFQRGDYDRTTKTWSGNTGLVWKATANDTFKAGYGRGIQMPSAIQTGYNQIFVWGGVPVNSMGNPLLRPTVTQTYNVDYVRKVEPLHSDVTVSLFRQYVSDIAAPFVVDPAGRATMVNGNPYFISYAQNVGSSNGYGTELQLKGSYEGFRWDGSYSVAIVRDSADVARLVNYERSTPRQIFRLGLGYSTGAWEFDVANEYNTSTSMLRSTDGGTTQNPMLTGGYYTASGRIGYQITDWLTAAVSGNHINRSQTTTSPFPAVERQAFFTLTGQF